MVSHHVAVGRHPAAPPLPAGRALNAAGSRSVLEGVRVLVVDDDLDQADLAAVLLRNAGATVTTALDSSSALGLAGEVDVLVADVLMPGMDGHELLRAVAALLGVGAPPALALTAHATADAIKLAQRAGFLAFLSKPYEAADLVFNVAALVRPGRSEG